MTCFRPTIAVLICLANSLPAQTGTAPLPPLATVIQCALARAAAEDDNDREFNRNYHYERIRLTEYRNGKGELKKHEEKRTPEGAGKAKPAPVVAPQTGREGRAAFRDAFQHPWQGVRREGLFAHQPDQPL